MLSPISCATRLTNDVSSDPFSCDGVPTQTNEMSVDETAAKESVVAFNRPARTTARMLSVSFGSTIGDSPRLRISDLVLIDIDRHDVMSISCKTGRGHGADITDAENADPELGRAVQAGLCLDASRSLSGLVPNWTGCEPSLPFPVSRKTSGPALLERSFKIASYCYLNRLLISSMFNRIFKLNHTFFSSRTMEFVPVDATAVRIVDFRRFLLKSSRITCLVDARTWPTCEAGGWFIRSRIALPFLL